MSLILLSLSLLSPANAGTNAQAVSGIVAYEAQDHELAIEKLTEALSEPVKVKKKTIPKAQYTLAKALLASLAQAAQSGDTAALAARQDAPLQAAELLLLVRDGGSSYSALAEVELLNVSTILMQGVLGALSLQGASPEALGAFLPWADMTVRIDESSHLAHDLRGQLLDRSGDKVAAYESFQAALSAYESSPPSTPDLLIPYTAYRAAFYLRYEQGDLAGALAQVERGQALLAQEWARIDGPTPDQQRQHATADADLTNFRLDILLNAPDLHQTALAEFAAAVEADPGSAIKWIAYAQLLESVDPAQAEAAYGRAIEADPSSAIASFNLGALYVNRAVAAYQAANEVADFGQAAELQAEGDAWFGKARPHLERALELEPGNREAIRALKQIAIQTDDIEFYRQLQSME